MPQYAQASTVPASGTAVVGIQQNNLSAVWIVHQLTVQTTHPTPGCTVMVKLNGFLVCATISGSNDSADGDPPIILRSGDTLDVTFSTATPGDQGIVTLYFEEQQLDDLPSTLGGRSYAG